MVPARRRAAGCARMAPAGGRLDARREGRTARRRATCGSSCCNAEEEWLRRRAERGAACSSQALDQIDELERRASPADRPAGAVYLDRPWFARRRAPAGCRSTRPARLTTSIRRPDRSRVSPAVAAASRCRADAAADDARIRSKLSIVGACSVSLIGSFLNVVIHRLPRRQSIVSPGIAVSVVRLRAALVRQHPGPELRRCSAAAAASAARRSASATRSSS